MTTVSHVAAGLLLGHATGRGAATTALAQLDVPASALAKPGRLPIGRMYRAWAAPQRETGDAAIGVHAAKQLTLDDLGLFGFCVAAAPTLRDALTTAAAYIGLITNSGMWRLAPRNDETRMIWTRGGPASPGLAISNEVMTATFLCCLRGLFPRTPVRIEWRHARWQPRTGHADILGCDVRFGAGDDALAIGTRDLDAATPSANRALWQYLCSIAAREVGTLCNGSLADRARAVIAESLDRNGCRLDAPAVARSLGTSERSLRRYLAADGTSVRALLADVCLERGAELLDQTDASITNVALDSGFSDGSAFARAWRRRRGASPSGSRRRA